MVAGLVYIEQGEEDHLMHFRWKDRATGKVEDDLIIFPDDIEYKKVAQCTTGRVFVLKFTITSRRMFFWMQVKGILQPNSCARPFSRFDRELF